MISFQPSGVSKSAQNVYKRPFKHLTFINLRLSVVLWLWEWTKCIGWEYRALLLFGNVSPTFVVEWSVLKLRSDIFGELFCILSGCLEEAISREEMCTEQPAEVTSITRFVLEAEPSPPHDRVSCLWWMRAERRQNIQDAVQFASSRLFRLDILWHVHAEIQGRAYIITGTESAQVWKLKAARSDSAFHPQHSNTTWWLPGANECV